jgi:HSP20 family protein
MTKIVAIDPIQELNRFSRLLDRFAENSENRWTAPSHSLPLDVYEQDNQIVVRASVPGVKPEDIDVSLEESVLTIKGEFKNEMIQNDAKVYRKEISYGNFVRSIRLPDNVNNEAVVADFRDGILEIRIPRAEPLPVKSVKVPVRSAANVDVTGNSDN